MPRVSSGWSVRVTLRAWILALSCLVCLAGIVSGPPAAAGQDHAPTAGQMLSLMNRARQHRHLHGLHMDRGLSRKVHRHSAQMARRHRLFHSRNVGRYLRGRRWHEWGENIGEVSGSLGRLQRLFMHSPVHRANILNKGFHHAGIGVVNARGRLWVTIVFYG